LKNNNLFHKHKGLSTIIGGFIFLVLFASGTAAITAGLNTYSTIVQTQTELADIEFGRIQEQFSLFADVDANDANKLSLNVTNKGKVPIEIDALWISNFTSSDATADSNLVNVTLADAFVPILFEKKCS